MVMSLRRAPSCSSPRWPRCSWSPGVPHRRSRSRPPPNRPPPPSTGSSARDVRRPQRGRRAPARRSTTSSTACSTSPRPRPRLRAIQRLGFKAGADAPPPAPADGVGMPMAFPPADSNYHDYAEMIAELNQVVADHPAIAAQDQHRHLATRAATCR